MNHDVSIAFEGDEIARYKASIAPREGETVSIKDPEDDDYKFYDVIKVDHAVYHGSLIVCVTVSNQPSTPPSHV